MKFVYLSENKIYLWNDGKVKEIQSERVAHYTDTVRSINKSKEWKETGTGANFIGTARMHGADGNKHFKAVKLLLSGKAEKLRHVLTNI